MDRHRASAAVVSLPHDPVIPAVPVSTTMNATVYPITPAAMATARPSISTRQTRTASPARGPHQNTPTREHPGRPAAGSRVTTSAASPSRGQGSGRGPCAREDRAAQPATAARIATAVMDPARPAPSGVIAVA